MRRKRIYLATDYHSAAVLVEVVETYQGSHHWFLYAYLRGMGWPCDPVQFCSVSKGYPKITEGSGIFRFETAHSIATGLTLTQEFTEVDADLKEPDPF